MFIFRFGKIVSTLERVVYATAAAVHKIGLGVLFLMMLLTVIDVVGLYFFNFPVPGAFEVTKFMLAILIFLSLGYTQIKREHISIDVVMTRCSKHTQNIVQCFNYLVCIILFAIIIWQTIGYAMRLSSSNTTSGVLAWPVYLLYFLRLLDVLSFFWSCWLTCSRSFKN